MISLADRLLPDALWQRLQPLLPPPPSRARGGAPRTVSGRLAEWAKAGVFEQLHLDILDRLGERVRLDWSRASVDSASVRAKRGGPRGRKSGRSWQAWEQAPPCL